MSLVAFHEYVVTQCESIRQAVKEVEKTQLLMKNKLDSIMASTGLSLSNQQLPDEIIFPFSDALQVEQLEEQLEDSQNLRDSLVNNMVILVCFTLILPH